VRARHARVPAERDVGRLVAADREAPAVAGEVDDELSILTVAQHDEGRTRRLGAQAVAQLGGCGDVGAQGRSGHGQTLRRNPPWR
jgi:hypothetical protein